MQKAPTFTIPIDIRGGRSIGHDWGRANRLVVFNRTNYDRKKQSQNSTQLVDVIRNVSFYENKFSRSLISESAELFKVVQRVSMKMDPLNRQELIKASRKYRSIIHLYQTKMRKENNEQLLQLCQMFYQIEVIWNLCEILYMDIHPTGHLLNQLLAWIRWHYTDIVTKANEIISSEVYHLHNNYWSVILSYICRCEIENARRFLELHQDSDSEEFIHVCHLLNKMPINSPHLHLHEFYLRWQNWHDECKKFLDQGYFRKNTKIQLIVRLLCGESDVFIELANLGIFDSWIQMMAAILLYCDPCIKEYNLHLLSTECMEKFFQITKSKKYPFDNLLVAAFGYDLNEVIQESCECFNDNWWFASHFIDLMYNANQLNDCQIDEPEKFREFFITDYANSLITHENLWTFGIDYLEYCPNNGMQLIELNLQRLSFSNDYMAQKMFDVAHKHHIVFVMKSICRINAKKWLMKKRLGTALTWAIRSEDAALTTQIADEFINTFYNEGIFPDEDVLSNLGSTMLNSDRLIFLAKYYEFISLKKEGKLNSAAELLVSLLVSHLAPRFFIQTLLIDSLPLLEGKKLVLNAEQTCQLLVSLEEFLNSDDKTNKDNFDQYEGILRLAISRNLARAFVFPTVNC